MAAGRWILVVMLAAGLAVSSAAPASKKQGKEFRPKDWIGRPAGDLIAVLGQPDEERPARKGSVLVWRRYPMGVPRSVELGTGRTSTWDSENDTDPPPLPGDPTVEPLRIIECTARIDSMGMVAGVSMPRDCRVPAPAAGDSPEKEKPELPRSQQPGPR